MLALSNDAKIALALAAYAAFITLVVGWTAYRTGRTHGRNAHHKLLLETARELDQQIAEDLKKAFATGYDLGGKTAQLQVLQRERQLPDKPPRPERSRAGWLRRRG